MAQKVTTEFIDDIDGSVAERTFTFAVDGTNYEIDLSTSNIAEFNAAIGGFVESARRVKASGSGYKARATSGAQADREQLRAIREWAKGQGLPVSDRGRISREIRAKFDAAHASSQSAPEPALAPAYGDMKIGWA